MSAWLDVARRVAALEDVALDAALVGEAEARSAVPTRAIDFFTPTFKTFHSAELGRCGKGAWPAVSITGGDCKLQCDHCKAKILEPMIPARTPEALWRSVGEIVAAGGGGMLLTGGSNRRNEVEYDAFYPTVRRIKDTYPHFKIALHTALVTRDSARRMQASGIDAAMMDVIGAQETITQVYHLKRGVEDFERTLETLVASDMRVVPHIVIGLHYGRLLGEWNALAMLQRHRASALVLVVAMPMYAPAHRPFAVPDPTEIGRFFLAARAALPDTPLLLGCARPPGTHKLAIDAYAVMAGVDGIAHPAEGAVELAARLGRRVRAKATCCSIGVGDEALAGDAEHAGLDAAGIDRPGIELDLPQILAHERRARGIVVAPPRAPSGGGRG